MLVLGLGLALRAINNDLDLGLISQGLGLPSFGPGLGLSHWGLTLHVRTSRSCSKWA